MTERKPTYLTIASPSGWKLVSAETDIWLRNLCVTLGGDASVNVVANAYTSGSRIAMGRNFIVQSVKNTGTTHLLFIDPDMVPDAYMGVDPNATPIWATFWEFMQKHDGPCVLAAPYCGQTPRNTVQIFSPNGKGDLKRVTREQAAKLHGWMQIGGAGTGFILIDMRVFDVLTPPYFHDTYKDETEAELQNSQDVSFSKKCWAAGIPMYANFDCWCDHQQMTTLKRPGWVDPPPKAAPELIVQ